MARHQPRPRSAVTFEGETAPGGGVSGVLRRGPGATVKLLPARAGPAPRMLWLHELTLKNTLASPSRALAPCWATRWYYPAQQPDKSSIPSPVDEPAPRGRAGARRCLRAVSANEAGGSRAQLWSVLAFGGAAGELMPGGGCESPTAPAAASPPRREVPKPPPLASSASPCARPRELGLPGAARPPRVGSTAAPLPGTHRGTSLLRARPSWREADSPSVVAYPRTTAAPRVTRTLQRLPSLAGCPSLGPAEVSSNVRC
jgi:hypothetical protein